jgi:Xaa-Pro aminopeptidase
LKLYVAEDLLLTKYEAPRHRNPVDLKTPCLCLRGFVLQEKVVAIKTFGTMAVDWEQRIDFDRLRRERLARIKELLAESEMGAVLCFDMNNVRYITATHIGTWAQDKISRFTLLPQGDEPILWDFGSAARHHQLNCPWLGERSRAGIPLMRGAMTPEMGRSEDVARKIRIELESRGLLNEPRGVDVVEPPILFALQREGINVVDGQQLMSNAREIKTQDEISLLTQAAGMVDGAYYDLYKEMKPGMRESDAVALVAKRLYEMGSEYVEGVNAISGERCSPHPHVFSDRIMRPGDPVYYDILHSYMGYRTCYYRCFAISSAPRALVDAYKRCRDYLDAAIDLVRPGRTTAEIAAVWPKAQEFGFPNEEAAFALQMGHGIGLAIWEKPMISRLVSHDHPHEIKPGMVFALETFWPSTDGWSAARIEEEIVVTPTGHEVITRFPAEELLVAGAPFVTVGGTLPTMRETEAPPNPEVVKMVKAAAKAEADSHDRVGA